MEGETKKEISYAEMWGRKAKFELGILYISPEVHYALFKTKTLLFELLSRHQSGDWGDLCDEGKAENERSIEEGFRIVSVYILPETGDKIAVFTEGDRSETGVM